MWNGATYVFTIVSVWLFSTIDTDGSPGYLLILHTRLLNTKTMNIKNKQSNKRLKWSLVIVLSINDSF